MLLLIHLTLKKKITRQTGNNDKTDVEIMVPLKYLSNFWRTLKMPLISCEINIDLNWSKNYVIVPNNANQATRLSITDTKPYVSIVTLSTQDNAILLKQLKYGFKITIGWNKYQSKISTGKANQYLDYLIDPCFQIVNRLFKWY